MEGIKLLNRHRLLVGLAAIGRRNIDIAKATNMSPSTVCRLLKRKLIIEAIDLMQEKIFKALALAKNKSRPEVISLLENLASEMECSTLNDELRLKAFKKYMDITLGDAD